MRRATNLCRQLNSAAIKGRALRYLSPIIVGKCSVIGARYIANKEQLGLEKAWKDVCHLQDNCDKAMSGKKYSGSSLAYRCFDKDCPAEV